MTTSPHPILERAASHGVKLDMQGAVADTAPVDLGYNPEHIAVVRNGLVEEVPVEIGIRTPEKVQIIGALKEGDQVLISGLLAVRPGMPVKTKLAEK